MKKLFILTQLTLAIAGYSSFASADGHHHHHHHGHHHHRGWDYQPHTEVYHYYPQREIVHHHYAQPEVHHYYPQPQANYYPDRGYYDQRSGAGLVGGVLGSALGYEVGRGDPIAAGLGAAAGSYIGNRH
jgi:hypothetical protein